MFCNNPQLNSSKGSQSLSIGSREFVGSRAAQNLIPLMHGGRSLSEVADWFITYAASLPEEHPPSPPIDSI